MVLVIDSPRLDTLFTALGHAKRRGIIATLSYRPATISQLADEYALSLPAIHKHIRVLETAGLIERRKVGRTNFVALQAQALQDIQDWIMQFRTEWGSDSQTLENYLASLEKRT